MLEIGIVVVLYRYVQFSLKFQTVQNVVPYVSKNIIVLFNTKFTGTALQVLRKCLWPTKPYKT
jgi:hypothetical protein